MSQEEPKLQRAPLNEDTIEIEYSERKVGGRYRRIEYYVKVYTQLPSGGRRLERNILVGSSEDLAAFMVDLFTQNKGKLVEIIEKERKARAIERALAGS